MSRPWAYYNEHDPFAAAWLRELMKDDLIAPGEVDERSIEDVTPDELRSFRQCHFFAGIGVWSIAARRAGWADDEALWTGSCPCQPFSAAGKGEGFADERHLWPSFHYLIEQCGPSVVAGEQVTGADGDTWFDLVSADLDATAYAFGVAETCAAGFGAPHERSRNYWVAFADQSRLEGRSDTGATRSRIKGRAAERDGSVSRLAVANRDGHRQHRDSMGESTRAGKGELPDRSQRVWADIADDYAAGGLADGHGHGRDPAPEPQLHHGEHHFEPRGSAGSVERPGPVNGLWRDADWLFCRDQPVPKWRPVESGTFTLVDAGTFRNRVGLLRGAGNACTLAQAEGFLRAVRGIMMR